MINLRKEWINVYISKYYKFANISHNIFGTFYYVYHIIIVRITGKRSLAEMNAFDMIVNIAIGSILSQLIIDETIPLIEGLVLISILIILQYIITFVSTRIEGLNKIIKSQPTLMYYKDHFIEENLKKERMTKSEIEQGIRNSGNGSFEEISAVILESDGSLSVIKNVNENNELEKYK